MPTPPTYWDYIKIEEILGLQTGLQDTEEGLGNDEVMFIVIHQIDELWFKLVLRELVAIRNLFAAEHVAEQSLSTAVRRLRRTELLFRQVSSHFALMETLTTRDYLAFRDKLSPASGFQSAQLREIEILLGLPGHMGFIIIEHDMDVALRVAESVTMMHNGRIFKEGKPAEIEEDPEVQALYLGGDDG